MKAASRDSVSRTLSILLGCELFLGCAGRVELRPRVSLDARCFPKSVVVTVTNASIEEMRIWELWNSWGHDVFRFEAYVSGHRTYVIQRQIAAFTKNYPSYATIRAGGSLDFVLDLNDETWAIPPELVTDNRALLLRALLSVPPTDETRRMGVYVGTVQSPWAHAGVSTEILEARGQDCEEYGRHMPVLGRGSATQALLSVLATDTALCDGHKLRFAERVYATDALALDALLAGEIDVCIANECDVSIAAFDRAPLAIVASVQRSLSGAALVAEHRSPVNRPEDLAGRRLGMVGDNRNRYVLRACLARLGLTEADIELVVFPSRQYLEQATLTGTVDAVFRQQPMASALLNGRDERLINVLECKIPDSSLIVCQRAYLETHRQLVQSFLQSLQAATEELSQQPLLARTLTMRAFPRISREIGACWDYSAVGLFWDDSVAERMETYARCLMPKAILTQMPDFHAMVAMEHSIVSPTNDRSGASALDKP